MIKILELFGGIGAPRCALRNLGVPIKSIDYVEIDEKAVRSYNAMFEKELQHKIQSVVNYNLKPDILIHGSPCQDFSIAGHQKGADEGSETRSSLMWETVHIIEQMGEWKPKVVIWENVKNVLSKYMKRNFDNYIDYMKKIGYSNSYEILNAIDYGLPQKRERVFVVSTLGNQEFDFTKLKQREMIDINTLLEHFDVVEDKYIMSQPSMLKKLNLDKNCKFKGTLNIINDVVGTITTKQVRFPNSGIIDLKDGRYRYLTEKECWRLQGFDDEDFNNAKKANQSKDGCLNSALYKQAGNSMPVTVLEEMFRVLLNDFFEFNLEYKHKEIEKQKTIFDFGEE